MSFCYFWALDMAQTYAVPGLFMYSVTSWNEYNRPNNMDDNDTFFLKQLNNVHDSPSINKKWATSVFY